MSSTKAPNCHGKVQIVKSIPTFMWTIDNFCACHYKTNEPLKSPIFSMGNAQELKWCIHLYPKGFDKSYADHISLFLQFESLDQGDVKIKYKFSILNSKNVRTHEMKSDSYRKFTPGCDWGFREFILRDDLFDEKNGLLPDNKLSIFCEIDVSRTSTNIFNANPVEPIKLPDEQAKLLDDLESLMGNKKFCDLMVVVNDKKLYAHKMILAARSTVFLGMLEQGLVEKKVCVVEINDFSEQIVREMLRFIYTGRVKDLDNLVDELLAVAHKYALNGLKTICEHTISKKIKVDNVAQILTTADRYNASELKKKCMEFIVAHGEDVTNTEGFKTMVTSQPQLIAEAFQTAVRPFFMTNVC